MDDAILPRGTMVDWSTWTPKLSKPGVLGCWLHRTLPFNVKACKLPRAANSNSIQGFEANRQSWMRLQLGFNYRNMSITIILPANYAANS